MGRPGFMQSNLGVLKQYSSGNSSDEVSNFRADKISSVSPAMKASQVDGNSPAGQHLQRLPMESGGGGQYSYIEDSK